ncbi:MAG: sensor histidine kinase [Butyrivibrio sp.]|nr:sensor histidine kinase [Butyrivibrio sp.]
MKKRSLKNRVMLYMWISIVPLTVLVVCGTLIMYSYYHQYDRIVSNITSANEYNLSFKEDMDEIMYQIVIGSANWTNSAEKLKGKDPYALISAARDQFRELQQQATDPGDRKRLNSVIKLMNTLEDRDRDITDNVQEGGHYDENITMLNMNVYTLTTLIQKQIQIYISYEASRMEVVRQNVSRQVSMTLLAVMSLLVGILGISFYISRQLTRKIIRPLQDMCHATEEFAQGDFSVRFPVTQTHNEIDTLAESFNSMVQEIAELVEDIRTEQHNQRMTELRLLQAQINPHFLYNTLDTIIWLTESGEKKEAVSMLTTLSNFFRTTLSKGRDFITIAEEEEHIRSYLEIQQFRYHDILEYDIRIPEQIQQYQICKLTLQPIVENALYHGIKNKRGGGKITVDGKIENGSLIFEVGDNGIGMTQQELIHLRGLISGEVMDEEQHGFGMANVQQRIQLYFGKDYGVSVESTYLAGTVIRVVIPAILEPIS